MNEISRRLAEMATLVLLSDRDLFRLRATVIRPCTVHFCLAWAVSVVRNERRTLECDPPAISTPVEAGKNSLKPALIGRPAIGPPKRDPTSDKESGKNRLLTKEGS